MKILYLSDNFPPETNACAIRVLERARCWVEAGHQVTVVTCAPNFPTGTIYPGYRNRWRQWEQVDGVDVLRVKTYMVPNRGWFRRTLDQVSFGVMATIAGAFVARPDVVVATSPQFFAGMAGGIVARLRRRPFVLELGDLWPASVLAVGAMRRGLRIRLAEWLEQRLYNRAERIIALTAAFRTELVERRGVPDGKIEVIYNGIRAEAVQPSGEAASIDFGFEPELTVGYIGNHGMAHRLEIALDAAEALAGRNIAFLFVGDGAEREQLEADAARRGLSNVRFVGQVPRSHVGDYWQMVDVALVQLRKSPILSTAMPSKMLEASVAGKPIVLAAPRGEATTLLDTIGAGICVPPENASALAEAILRFADDRALMDRCAAAACAAAPQFSASDSAARALAILESVSSAPPLPAAHPEKSRGSY